VCNVKDATYIFSFRVGGYGLCVRLCDVSAVRTAAEYQWRFPNRRIPTRRVFTGFYQATRNSSTLYSIRITVEREVHEITLNNKTLFQMVLHSSRASTWRTARYLSVSPFERMQNTAHRGHAALPGEANAIFLAWRFCWEAGIMQLTHWQFLVALFQSVCWRSNKNPCATVESSFQQCFGVIVRCAGMDDHLVLPSP